MKNCLRFNDDDDATVRFRFLNMSREHIHLRSVNNINSFVTSNYQSPEQHFIKRSEQWDQGDRCERTSGKFVPPTMQPHQSSEYESNKIEMLPLLRSTVAERTRRACFDNVDYATKNSFNLARNDRCVAWDLVVTIGSRETRLKRIIVVVRIARRSINLS